MFSLYDPAEIGASVFICNTHHSREVVGQHPDRAALIRNNWSVSKAARDIGTSAQRSTA
jgi:hypothetical protein